MAQDRRLVREPQPLDGGRGGHHLRRCIRGLLELAGRVDASRHREPNELEGRMAILARRRVTPGHDRPDLDATHSAGQVERAGQRLRRERLGREMSQHRPGVQVDGMPAERPQHGGAGLAEHGSEVGDLLDPVAKVVLAEDLAKPDGDRLEVPAGEAP
jgi:hypothetical protein